MITLSKVRKGELIMSRRGVARVINTTTIQNNGTYRAFLKNSHETFSEVLSIFDEIIECE